MGEASGWLAQDAREKRPPGGGQRTWTMDLTTLSSLSLSMISCWVYISKSPLVWRKIATHPPHPLPPNPGEKEKQWSLFQ